MSRHDHDRDRGTAGDPPERWVKRWVEAAANPPSAEDGDVERRIGALFAKVPAPTAFDAGARERVAARLRPSNRRQEGLGAGWSRRRLALGLAFGAVVLLLSGAVIAGGGVRVLWNRLRPTHPVSPVASAEPPSHPQRQRPRRGGTSMGDGAESTPPLPTAPVQQVRPEDNETIAPQGSAQGTPAGEAALSRTTSRPRRRALALRQAGRGGPSAVAASEPSSQPRAESPAVIRAQANHAAPVPPHETGGPSAPAVLEPAVAPPPLPPPSSSWMPAPDPAPRPARGAPTTAAAPPPPSQLSQEARLLNVAMVQLRQRRDGAAALATLNEYLARYPRGMLADEARGARIDALLLLQRKNEALRALDAADLAPVGRGQELLVIRGELRARRDCADAIRDFNLVLGGAAPSPLQERALFGRAVCRRRQGNEQGARTDADAYLTRFPAGRFEASARRLADGNRVRTP